MICKLCWDRIIKEWNRSIIFKIPKIKFQHFVMNWKHESLSASRLDFFYRLCYFRRPILCYYCVQECRYLDSFSTCLSQSPSLFLLLSLCLWLSLTLSQCPSVFFYLTLDLFTSLSPSLAHHIGYASDLPILPLPETNFMTARENTHTHCVCVWNEHLCRKRSSSDRFQLLLIVDGWAKRTVGTNRSYK